MFHVVSTNTPGVIISDITSSQHEVVWYSEFFFNDSNNNNYVLWNLQSVEVTTKWLRCSKQLGAMK